MFKVFFEPMIIVNVNPKQFNIYAFFIARGKKDQMKF